MDLWIRSQDKMTLSKARDLRLFELNKKWCIVVIWNNDRDQLIYAKYSTKEKALKVLDEIQKYIYSDCRVIVNELGLVDKSLSLGTVVYEMPADK